jgi:hypothetical protein
MADRLPPLWYGEGVKFTITWLLGDWTAPPVDPAGRGPYAQDSEVPALLHDAETRQPASERGRPPAGHLPSARARGYTR